VSRGVSVQPDGKGAPTTFPGGRRPAWKPHRWLAIVSIGHDRRRATDCAPSLAAELGHIGDIGAGRRRVPCGDDGTIRTWRDGLCTRFSTRWRWATT